MQCIQLVSKFLFHTGFHTKKTLRYVGVVILCGRGYIVQQVGITQQYVLVYIVQVLLFLIIYYSNVSSPITTGVQPMNGLMPSTPTYTTVHPLEDGSVRRCFSVTLTDYASLYWSHLRPRWVWSSGCGHCYNCICLVTKHVC